MALRIFNTLTRRKEDFVPLVPGEVRMYVCGVTVYDLSHIGHARSAIVFDVIRRYLESKGTCVVLGSESGLTSDPTLSAVLTSYGTGETLTGMLGVLGPARREYPRVIPVVELLGRALSDRLEGREAPTLEKWGLINLTVPEKSLEKATMAIAEEFAQGPTLAHAATKELDKEFSESRRDTAAYVFDSIVTLRRPMENRSICPVHFVTRASSLSLNLIGLEHLEISGSERSPQFHFRSLDE